MDAEYALSEADWRIVFQTLPQREMVVCVRPSEMSRQRAEDGIDVSSDKHPVHVHDVVGGQDDVQDFHESHLRETVCR
jgi:hypothetical protein